MPQPMWAASVSSPRTTGAPHGAAAPAALRPHPLGQRLARHAQEAAPRQVVGRRLDAPLKDHRPLGMREVRDQGAAKVEDDCPRHGASAPVISASSRKNPRLRADETPQVAGTDWYPSSWPSPSIR